MTRPLKRMPDGTHAPVPWEEAFIAVARRLATARSTSVEADLDICHGKNTVENCYLLPLLHIMTGNMYTPEGAHFPVTMLSGIGVLDTEKQGEKPRTRVAGIPVIGGIFPPNAPPDEILDAGEERIRALMVEACNPLRSYADTQAMTRAFDDLELLVVIDPAMTEPARLAHYVLPPPVLSAIHGVGLLFAMKNSEALVEAGTLGLTDTPGPELFQKLLDHPEGILLYRSDPTKNWEQVRNADQKAVLDAPEVLDRFRNLEIPEDTDFRT